MSEPKKIIHRKVKIKLPSNDGEFPRPFETEITDEAGNLILCHFPIDIHIDAEGSYVTLRMHADVEIEGKAVVETVECKSSHSGWTGKR